MSEEKPGFVSLACIEPFRVFFPLALIMGVLGVCLWPLYYGGCLSYYPMLTHARVMVECFVGGFALGFLTTALPKMLGVSALKGAEFCLLLLSYLAMCVVHLCGFLQLGDALFSLTLVCLLGVMLPRFIARKSSPAPGFVLALLGLGCGALGAGWSSFLTTDGGLQVNTFFLRLLYQGFILLPILGIGSFMFPMILGKKDKYAGLTGAAEKRMWSIRAIEALAVGILLITSYWIESLGETKVMSWSRAFICFIYITKESGWIGKLGELRAKGVMAFSIRAGITCLLLGMLLSPVFPMQRIGLEHSLYIGGFGLITMIVATRVIFGHTGQGSKFQLWGKMLTISSGLLLFTLATRISADFLPAVRVSHHVYAAACWVVVCIIWGVAILPSIRKIPPVVRPKPTVKKKSVLDMDFRK